MGLSLRTALSLLLVSSVAVAQGDVPQAEPAPEPSGRVEPHHDEILTEPAVSQFTPSNRKSTSRRTLTARVYSEVPS